MTSNDHAILCAMEKYGGSFVVALAKAARVADPDNLERLKRAFPEYWERYRELSMMNP